MQGSKSINLLQVLLVVLLLGIVNGSGGTTAAAAELSPDYYSSTCPNVSSIVKETVVATLESDKANGASLLRLHFHDCFVNGCDGSILLDDNSTFTGEKTAGPNNNSLRGYSIIDEIKADLETACPGVVSCADILAIAARDAVVQLGGPSWVVELGRRDSLTANKTAADVFLPSATLSLSGLISNFAVQGLSFRDMVALSGAHTIGSARCTSFRARIYNDTDINSTYRDSLKSICPVTGNDSTIAPLDVQTSTVFDNKYYENLMVKEGLLHSDQELYNGNILSDLLVTEYVVSQNRFFQDFAVGMVKMGNIKPLTGTQGEIRLNCRVANKPSSTFFSSATSHDGKEQLIEII